MLSKELAMCLIVCISSLIISSSGAFAGECQQVTGEIPKNLLKYSLTNNEVSKPYAFDDIGCALKWRQKQCISIQMTFDGTAKVYDHNTLKPLHARDAFFVMSDMVQSPAGYGIVAFEKREDAEKYLATLGGKGKVMSYDELLQVELR